MVCMENWHGNKVSTILRVHHYFYSIIIYIQGIFFCGAILVPYPLDGDVILWGASPTQLEPKMIPVGKRIWMTRRCDAFSSVF